MEEMESSDFVRDFENLHVLASYDFRKMDDLVHDLSLALEESSKTKNRHDNKHKCKKRRQRKRKSESVLVTSWNVANLSETSESSLDCVLKDFVEKLTDSSDSNIDGVIIPGRTKSLSLVESDSFTDTFTPKMHHRRRRKCKRMAMDVQLSLSPSVVEHNFLKPKHRRRRRKAKAKLSDSESKNSVKFLAHTAPGKRKRSFCEKRRVHPFDDSEGHIVGMIQNDSKMELNTEDCNHSDSYSTCSSSLSSSESDLGVFTHDEGREGDDEQSDYYHDSGLAYGIPSVKQSWSKEQDENQGVDANVQKILNGVFPHLAKTCQQNFRCRLNRLSGLSGREIRAGRRRLRERRLHGLPAWATTNEKICQYLLDSSQSELRLHLKKKQEQKNSMSCVSVASCAVDAETAPRKAIAKKHFLTQAAHPVAQLADMKRLKRTPPPSPESSQIEVLVGTTTVAAPLAEHGVTKKLPESSNSSQERLHTSFRQILNFSLK